MSSMEDVQNGPSDSKALDSPKTASGEAPTESVSMNDVQPGLNEPEMPENVSHVSEQAVEGPEQSSDSIRTLSTTNPKVSRSHKAVDSSTDDEATESDQTSYSLSSKSTGLKSKATTQAPKRPKKKLPARKVVDSTSEDEDVENEQSDDDPKTSFQLPSVSTVRTASKYVPLDEVQTAPIDRVDSSYAESNNQEGSEHDSPQPEEPEKPLSKKRKRAKAVDPEGSKAKKTKFNYGRAVREAVTRNLPSLRTQRKHLDENGNPLSVLAVIKQMTKDVLSPYEKEDWRSRDFAEDDRAEFERVRMMYVNDAAARKYSDADFDYNKIAKKDDVENVERKRWTLEQDGSGDESECASGTDASEPVLNDVELLPGAKAEYDYYDISDSEQRRKAKGSYKPKRRRIAKGFYKPKQMKEGTKKAIKEAIRTPPRYLYRASSESSPTKYRSTNGYDSITLHCPAAHVNDDESCHTSMYEIPNGLGEFSEMLGRRFLWHDRRRDEMLSWTSSLLFALVHATGRLAKGQEVIVIDVIDTTKVTTIDGQPVDFHFAPDLLRLLDIKGWYGWNKFDSNNLQRPWFTHEWVTHNVVKSPKEHSWEANIEDMIDQGLYTLLEHLRTPDGDDMRSLYHRCGYTRSMYHRKGAAPTPVTWDHFTLAKRLSRCFVARHIRQEDPYCIPALHLVIDLLGIEARPKRDEGFMAWIRSNYSQADLTNVEYDRSIRIANNLPEQMQALELSRDACFALGLPETAGTRVWMADENFNWYGKWLKDASREIKIRQRSKDAGEGLLMKEMKRMADGAEEKMAKADEGKKGKKAVGVVSATAPDGAKSGSEEENDVQMQMALAASLEPGLLGAAGDGMGLPLHQSEAGRQPLEGDDEARTPQSWLGDDL